MDKEKCSQVRKVANQCLKKVAEECGLKFEVIKTISFNDKSLKFKVEFFDEDVDIPTLKVDRHKLLIYGLTLGQEVELTDGKKYKLVGTYRNGFVVERDGETYRCQTNMIKSIADRRKSIDAAIANKDSLRKHGFIAKK